MKKVWIVYREYPINPHQWGKKVEFVVETKKEALLKCKELEEKLDTRFGISYQKWYIDK